MHNWKLIHNLENIKARGLIDNIEKYSDKELTRILTYTEYVFLSFELVKNMIVDPIKAFYENIVF